MNASSWSSRPVSVAALGIVALSTALVGGLTVVHAATTSSKAVHACASRHTGALRVAKKACRGTETTVVWNLKGVPGRNGKDGTPGGKGSRGPKGETGTDGTGTSVAYANSSRDTTSRPVITESMADIVAGSVSVPAGTYAVNMAISFDSLGPDPHMVCRLDAPQTGGGVHYSPDAVAPPLVLGAGNTLGFTATSMSSAVSVPVAGAIQIICTTADADVSHPVSVNEWAVTATSVSSLNGDTTPTEGWQ
jgi:hypothetical protein